MTTTAVSGSSYVNDALPAFAYRWDEHEGQPESPRLLGVAVPAYDGPDHLPCLVDHDGLPARTAAYGKRRGVVVTYWSCPACPYYFTAITAAPGTGFTQRHRRVDRLGGSGVIRAWAIEQGIHVGKTGMLSEAVVDAYEQAHAKAAS